MNALRVDYEREVRAISEWAAEELAAGASVEATAREAVDRRNALKIKYRGPLSVVERIRLEDRNVAKYGHPIGPTADWMFERYGSWAAVLAAAARPADLQKQPIKRNFSFRRL